MALKILLNPKNFFSALLIFCFTSAFSQSMTLTPITTVCPTGSGTASVSFTGVTYPFTLNWYNGSNVQNGSATITASPQTITINGRTSGGNYGNRGASLDFYMSNNSIYLGEFGVGINYDPIGYLKVTCSGGTLTVNNIAGGTAPYTIELIDASTGTAVVSGASPLAVTYAQACPLSGLKSRVKVSDANGCYAMQDSFTVSCEGLKISSNTTKAGCSNGTTTITAVTGGTTPYSYLWDNGNTTNALTGLVRGPYNCTVTDATGCSGMAYTYVEQNPYIAVNTNSSPAKCINADGKSTAFPTGGTAPYTYLWDNGSTTAAVTNLTGSQLHKVIVTDANGCTGDGQVFIGTSTPITVNYTNTSSSCTSNTGTATITPTGGATPYTYSWPGLSSTTNSISSVGVGNYSFLVVDANGCKRDGAVNIPPVSVINASISTKDAICPANTGDVIVKATGSATPLTYLWSNSATTSSITGVTTGGYSCTITDANLCKVSKSTYLAQISPVKINMGSSVASCIYTSDASASATAFGGTAPYTYQWSNSATTATISGIPKGHYYVTTKDANGCTNNNYVNVGYNPAGNLCYCNIEGIVYNDLNSNCTQDAGEDGISNVLINTNGGGYNVTDDNGHYSIKVPSGSYTVEQVLNKYSALASCQSNNISYTATTGSVCNKTINFANNLTAYHDVHSFMVSKNSPVPGNTYVQEFVVVNVGNTTETKIQTTYSHDGQLGYIYSSGPLALIDPAFPNDYKFSSPITLKSGKDVTYNVYYNTPTNIPMGTDVNFLDSIAYDSPVYTYWLTGEESPWNNTYASNAVVRSSYDPNFKEVFPAGTGNDGIIALTEKDFRYVVHFENNGTAPAQKVVVIDTLDSDLDLETFRTLTSSHKMNTQMDKNGVVTFTFDNINLAYTPKNVYNEFAQGWLAYTIKPKAASVKVGTEIHNMAGIYFDYNEPVFTNTTVNTYVKKGGNSKVQSIAAAGNSLIAFPNPTTGLLNLKMNGAFGSSNTVEVYNLQGQVVLTQVCNGNELALNTNAFTNGIYIVKVVSNNGAVASAKFVKQ